MSLNEEQSRDTQSQPEQTKEHPLLREKVRPPSAELGFPVTLEPGFPLLCIARIFWFICKDWAFLSMCYLSHVVHTCVSVSHEHLKSAPMGVPHGYNDPQATRKHFGVHVCP